MRLVDIGGLMPKTIFIIAQPEHTFYLVQKVETTDLYTKSKMITEFLEKETKKLEFVINNEIKSILREKGINILSNKESAYKTALDTLKHEFNKVIDIEDLYKDKILENCEYIGVSNNGMTVVLEDNKYLQTGIQVKEIDII